jgi:uncharacterized Zn finger protein
MLAQKVVPEKKTYSEKLRDPRWQRKRLEIFTRDNWTCTQCGTKEKTLVVHHKEYLIACEPWDYPNELLITYCEDCHKINHQLIPELKFSENYVKCPICGDNFCHIIKQEHFAGDDKYRAWEGRGDLYLTIFWGECGSVFAKAYGEHKGNIVQGDLLIKSCGVYVGK